ncbi:MAG: GspE/PulE family protein [Proteocatella sp.]
MYRIDYGITNLIPEKMAKEYKCIPVAIEENKLSVAVSKDAATDNFTLLREYFTKMGISKVELLNFSELEIERLINTYYSIEFENKNIGKILEDLKIRGEAKWLFEYIMESAIDLNASDIHMMNEDEMLVIRFRIKGKLKTFTMIEKSLGEKIIRILKVRSNIEISKTKAPKDSRLKYFHNMEEVDIRVSILNTIQSEKVSLRILNRENIPLNLSELSISEYEKNVLKRAISLSSGFVLICGPTGSGKSTTLRCLLNEINDAEKHIVSIEDPIEYTIKGTTQIQVDNSVENGFNRALRYIVRQDPDIIYIGEIRDFESADVATKASLTGHLVFSTLHTRDSRIALERMENLGVDRNTIISSLNVIINQRLAGILCENCKIKTIYKGEAIEELGIKAGSIIYESSGCKDCDYSGYEKIAPIMEILVLNDKKKVDLINLKSEDLSKGELILKMKELLHLGKIELKEALKYLWY